MEKPAFIQFDIEGKVSIGELGAGVLWPFSHRSHGTCYQLWEH